MKFRLVVSLCHFCELHGPAVLMSTQMMSLKSYNKLQKTFEQFSETINEEKTFCEVSFFNKFTIIMYTEFEYLLLQKGLFGL